MGDAAGVKARISLRVSSVLWPDPARRRELLALLEAHPGAVNELAFFTGSTHAPLPLEEIQRRAAALAGIQGEFRSAGLRCGINHLATIGHLDENLPYSLAEPWQHLVDISGAVSPSCYCVSDDRVQDYIRSSYRALAQAGPAFIWVDDDVRMEGHPGAVRLSCFCPRCLARFSAATGYAPDRAAIAAALDGRDTAEGLRVRRAWLEHGRQTIAMILCLAREGVDSEAPGLPLGLMTAEIAYSGYGFAGWADALAGPAGTPVMWRPGGGFYDDERPLDLIAKAHSVGRQVGLLPASVSDIQWEHENFPYQVLRKSRALFSAEIAAAAGCGCTGVALNVMGTAPDPLDEFRPLFDAVATARPFLDAVAGTFGRSACEGVWPAFGRDHAAAIAPGRAWSGPDGWSRDFSGLTELSLVGLPLAYTAEGARVAVLWGDSPLEWTRQQLEALLAGGVLMDGAALARCEEAGLGALCGFHCTGTRGTDTRERFTEDPLNGSFAGWHRDCRPSFWGQVSHVIEPSLPGARPLVDLVDFASARVGGGGGVYENAAGGRVAVFGSVPWTSLQVAAKVAQVRTVCRWLSRDTLPAWIDSFHRVAAWCRSDQRGAAGAVVLNTSIDAASGVMVRLHTAAATVRVVSADGRSAEVPVARDGTSFGCITLPDLAPWGAAMVRA
jgi:hypothetical protein